MGLSGSFVVQAVGQNPEFQWTRNGAPIPGATGSTYTTAPTAFSDTGSTFQVSVSNSAGFLTSQAALLTVTARAPIAGDLRFQQVDAPSTVNGYTSDDAIPLFCPVAGQGATEEEFPSAIGTSFFLGNNGCTFQFQAFALPAGVSGLQTIYSAGPGQQYPGLLGQALFGSGTAPDDPSSVITTLSLNQTGTAALGYVHSAFASGFVGTAYTVAASALQSLATQEGLGGRVITAISYDGAQATVFSYSWTGDPSSVYEAKVAFATLTTATDQITQMASEGYILTASGCTQAADGSGVILIGTRVQGDTMPRPFLVGDALATPETINPLLEQGYAIVGVVNHFQNSGLILKNYIGER